MSKNVWNYTSEVYVIDADTKQLIRHNLYFNYLPPTGDGPGNIGYVIYGGHLDYEISGGESFRFNFLESQITALGYDYNSITGNIVTPTYDPDLDTYLYPSVITIYISKK